jgi:acetyltransferase-like isoleucine patch superfamily enzyme
MADLPTLPHDWFPCPLPPNVAIGPRSWVYSSFAFLHCRSSRPCAVRVGHDSGVYHGTFFELGPGGEVEIGNFCTVVGAVIRTDRRVVIEDYALVSHEVVIADTFAPVPPGASVVLAGPGERVVSVAVRRNAWVGARAVLLGGADVGEGAIVGAGAVVDFPVPAFAVVGGNPARVVGAARPRERES